MVKRTLFFASPCHLSLKDCQLVVENHSTGEVKTVPIEDIGCVIIENQQVSVTVPALNAMSENNCAVVFCDNSHMPSSMLLNLEANTIQAETYRFQVDAGVPMKKNLWKQIVEAKIRNQAGLLDRVGLVGDVLKPYYSNVKSGDSDNREGLAAKLYWDRLLGTEFVRIRNGEGINAMLNYGYSVLRAGMARAIVGSGLFPSFGLFHKNRYNAFPLADDLMEPYRPYVDYIVYELYMDGCVGIVPEIKQALVRVLFKDTSFGTETRPLEVGLTMTSASLAKCLRGERRSILFPRL